MEVTQVPDLVFGLVFVLVGAVLAYDALQAWWIYREKARRWVK